jgi:acetyl esterase/lipase
MKTAALTAVLCLQVSLITGISAQTVLPLWPHGTPEPPQTTEPEQDVTKPTDALISGHRTARLTNVTQPTITVYPPASGAPPTDSAALVFPGGGYLRLAWDGEGVDTCRWINSLGMTCVLVKYRVPEQGRYPDNPADLEDAQQAIRMTRMHAAEWHISPRKIGVIGFSAGGNLAVLLSNHPDDHHVESTSAVRDLPHRGSDPNTVAGARAAFAILVYPAYLPEPPANTSLDPVYAPDRFTPPTFLLQAEDDKTYIDSSLVYFRALKDAGVPAELHIYATGGHGFGMHPVGKPEEHWTQTAVAWLQSIGMVPERTVAARSYASQNLPAPAPCPSQQAPIGRPSATPPPASDNPACW